MTLWLSDEELARRVRANPPDSAEKEAAAELFQRYQDQVYLWCFRRVQDHERALDLAQDVLLSAYRSVGSFEGRARYSSWLFAIMRNRCHRELRQSGRWKDAGTEPDELPGEGRTPEDLFIEEEDEEQVLELVRSVLEPQEQLALWLRCFEDLSVDEITRRLEITGATGA